MSNTNPANVLAITWNLSGKDTAMSRKRWKRSRSGAEWRKFLAQKISAKDPPAIVAVALQEWSTDNAFHKAFGDWLVKITGKTYVRKTHRLKTVARFVGQHFSQILSIYYIPATKKEGIVTRVKSVGTTCFGKKVLGRTVCDKGSLGVNVTVGTGRHIVFVASHFPFNPKLPNNNKAKNAAHLQTIRALGLTGDLKTASVVWMGDLNYRMAPQSQIVSGRFGDNHDLAEGEILSPVNGRVTKVERNAVTIYIPVETDHRVYSPVSGTIVSILAKKGKFEYVRFHPGLLFKATPEQKGRVLVIIQPWSGGQKVSFWLEVGQGYVTDRIRLDVTVHEEVQQAEVIGEILLGSLAEIQLPEGSQVLVSKGQWVRGGKTVVGKQFPRPPPLEPIGATEASEAELLDGLTYQRRRNWIFHMFDEGPNNRGPEDDDRFFPTCKMNQATKETPQAAWNVLRKARERGDPKTAYNPSRTPSYCDRILVRRRGLGIWIGIQRYEASAQGTNLSDHNAAMATLRVSWRTAKTAVERGRLLRARFAALRAEARFQSACERRTDIDAIIVIEKETHRWPVDDDDEEDFV